MTQHTEQWERTAGNATTTIVMEIIDGTVRVSPEALTLMKPYLPDSFEHVSGHVTVSYSEVRDAIERAGFVPYRTLKVKP